MGSLRSSEKNIASLPPSLGLMMFENGSIAVLRTNPHLLLFPAGTLTVLLFTFNLLGDAINDAFNPRAR